jgi:Flp pilus assembly protein TadG
MLRRFWADTSGNYAMITGLLMAPLFASIALAVDYSELVRQRAVMLSALDATGLAAAKRYEEGASPADLEVYANKYFATNLNGLDYSKLTLILPDSPEGGGKLKVYGERYYTPYLIPTAYRLTGHADPDGKVKLSAVSEIRLKNTLEVALVLDNSGSMDYLGGSSSQKRLDLLKAAAKELVTQLSAQAGQMIQIEKPVQFSLVPFAASVNIGTDKASKSWMDQDGISPIHHENFNWTTMSSGTKRVELSGGVYYKRGSGWGAQENQKVTRFTMYNDLQRITGQVFVKTGTESVCTKYNNKNVCTRWGTQDTGYYQDTYGQYASWKGCVETRPSPYNVNDAVPTTATPATLFVPMFAPDETDPTSGGSPVASNSWWADGLTGATNYAARQLNMPKYFTPYATAAEGTKGPNFSCTTKAITPLTDVSKSAGATAIKSAIDSMVAGGNTNVPEGMAWGWRTVSSTEPFTEGRSEVEKGNDKVVIVVTDGANTYSTYSPDSAGNKSTYAAFGHVKLINKPTELGRIFDGTTGVSKTTYTSSNYSSAMNSHFVQLCNNAKAKGIMVMTVALDLDASDSAEAAQMNMLKNCASNSRVRRDANGDPVKLYWNSTGSSLSTDFKAIGDELSNLRIVS